MSDVWTFLVYVAADDENTSGARSTVSALLEAELPHDVRVAMQVDRRDRETQRYLRTEREPQSSALGKNVNAGGAKALREFLEWGVAECPSRKTCLIVWGHGNGILGSVPSTRPTRGDAQRPDDVLTNRELREVLGDFQRATGSKMDVVALHSCLMGNAEVAFELAEVTRYFVASEDDAKQRAWPYADIFADLGEARAVARSIVDAFGDQSASGIFAAFEQSKMAELASAVGDIGEAACKIADEPQGHAAFESARQRMIALSDPNYVDLSSALDELGELGYPKVRASVKDAKRALGQALIKRAAVGQTHAMMGGLSIFFPSERVARRLLPLYGELAMSKKHGGWSAFLDVFVERRQRRH